MQYQEYLPSDNLKEIIKNYWHFEVPYSDEIEFPLDHETLPESEVSIVLIHQPYFSGVRLLGPHIQKFEQTIYPDSIYFGIRLLPWLTFTPKLFSVKKILNTTAECPDVISKYFHSIKFQESENNSNLTSKIETALKKLFTETLEVSQNELIKFICLELSSGKSIGKTVENIPLSVRVIQKKFKEVTGLSMRQYHSINRQRNLWSDYVKTDKDKTDLIYKYSFYDQAHFINDFKKKMNRPHSDFEKYLKQIKISLV